MMTPDLVLNAKLRRTEAEGIQTEKTKLERLHRNPPGKLSEAVVASVR